MRVEMLPSATDQGHSSAGAKSSDSAVIMLLNIRRAIFSQQQRAERILLYPQAAYFGHPGQTERYANHTNNFRVLTAAKKVCLCLLRVAAATNTRGVLASRRLASNPLAYPDMLIVRKICIYMYGARPKDRRHRPSVSEERHVVFASSCLTITVEDIAGWLGTNRARSFPSEKSPSGPPKPPSLDQPPQTPPPSRASTPAAAVARVTPETSLARAKPARRRYLRFIRPVSRFSDNVCPRG